MSDSLSRRRWLAGAFGLAALGAGRPEGALVDTHVHLFDPKRFPYHKSATYRPPAATLESYTAFVKQAGIDHAVIVHPEPYQDDHGYLEYCFAHEPSRGFFKGTCLFDPVAADTPARMEALVKKAPGRIVALRIHENLPAGKTATTSGPIRDRDMRHPAMKQTWRAAHQLGLAIQMHFIPRFAPQIGELAAQFRDMPVILDHLARSGQGTPAEFEQVLKLSQYPRVYMKYSGVSYSSKQPYPYADARPSVRKVYDAFGSGRILWGGLGMNMPDFIKASELLDQMFAFAAEGDRARIRGLNAMELFKF
ncbi:MAG TPA: amidohydrolase family protein [Bryobacteraceae bacterium]|nr:amidohydrolase family protein [Bryobacteraceae bacterium]